METHLTKVEERRKIVRVWFFQFSSQVSSYEKFLSLLSSDELQRLEMLKFEKSKTEYVVSRGLLRKILGKYTGTSPELIRFRYSEFGKPSLEFPAGTQIYFNLSHSGDVLMIAVSFYSGLGVDVEKVSAFPDLTEVATEVFSSKELTKLSLAKEREQVEVFFELWTLKEAYIKALGTGFSLDPKTFEVNEADHSFTCLGHDLERESAQLSYLKFIPYPGYQAAIVTDGVGFEVFSETDIKGAGG